MCVEFSLSPNQTRCVCFYLFYSERGRPRGDIVHKLVISLAGTVFEISAIKVSVSLLT